MRGFDEELGETWDYLQETGCNKRSNKDLRMKERQMLATSEFWNRNRGYLRSINDIMCSRIQNEATCLEVMGPHAGKRFVSCFRSMYFRPGLVDMLLKGPEKLFDRRLFCEAVFGLENCAYIAIGFACNWTFSTYFDITGEILSDITLIGNLATCHEYVPRRWFD